MHAAEIRDQALALIAAGVNDCEVARRLGLARTTVRDWRRPRYKAPPRPLCPRCWRRMQPLAFTVEDYSELLGLYLGDGHITRMARAERLRLFLDARYAAVVGEAEALLRRCFPRNSVGRAVRHGGAMVVLLLYNGHLSCLFPQHGAGKKHDRRIVLEPWQRELVAAAPFAFLRGCIRSDGCVFVNRTGRYEYVSYAFSNVSADILDLFEETCRSVGLRPRRSDRHIRLNRRSDVALMLDRVGVKA
jgi:hypothetical protein